jgi:hypothetical protein
MSRAEWETLSNQEPCTAVDTILFGRRRIDQVAAASRSRRRAHMRVGRGSSQARSMFGCPLCNLGACAACNFAGRAAIPENLETCEGLRQIVF